MVTIHAVVHGHGVLIYPLDKGVPHLPELPPFPLKSVVLKGTFNYDPILDIIEKLHLAILFQSPHHQMTTNGCRIAHHLNLDIQLSPFLSLVPHSCCNKTEEQNILHLT